jgi:cysteine desulfuration protein SufE
MDSIQGFLSSKNHRDIAEEVWALSTPEDRLTWLMERAPFHAPLELADRENACKVSGCLSGLWLSNELRDGRCFFQAYSESSLVHGVVSFVCDLYSDRSPNEIMLIGSQLTSALKLDGLLSLTRKRALAGTLEYIQAIAARHSPSSFDTAA